VFHVKVDRNECIMCGVCWGICPDLFEAGPDGLCQIPLAYQVAGEPGHGEAPDELRSCAEEAAVSCPVEIIHIIEK